MAGFDNETVYANNWDFRGVQPVIPQVTQEGELPIGTGASPAIEVGQITSPNGSIVVGYDNPDITLQVDPSITGIQSIDVDTSTPPGTDPVVPNISGQITVTGGQTAAGNVGANVIRTHSEAANAYTTEIQRASAEALPTLAANGVSHFDSEFFTIDGDGFVSLAGEGAVINFDVDTASGTGTDPVVPDTNGTIALTGAQVPAGTIANVIRTHSTTASSITTEIQQSSAQASSTPTANGVSHFDSEFFTVDGDGFVSLAGGGTILSFNVDAATNPGTDPVVPDGSGQVTVTGAQVAAGTIGANVIRTNSLAANTYTTEIQRSTAVASSASANNGVCHFDSAQFTVDANGFVQTTGITPNPFTVVSFVDDFIKNNASDGTGETNWITGASVGVSAIAGHPGVIQMVNGSTTLVAKDSGSFGALRLGDGSIELSLLIRATQMLSFAVIWMGLAEPDSSTAEPSDGVYFYGEGGVNSGNWQVKTANASTRTTISTSTPVVSPWYKLTITINAAGTEANFFINDVLVTGSPINTNLPTAALTIKFAIQSNSILQIDLVTFMMVLTNARY